MRLKDNKGDIIQDTALHKISYDELNVRNSNWYIWDNQDMGVKIRVTSGSLLTNIYYNEIKR